MKNYLSPLIAVIMLVLLGTVGVLTYNYFKHEKEIARLTNNYNQQFEENQFYTAKVDEMRTLIKQSDHRFKLVDSLLKQSKIKISQLEKVKVNTVTIINTDTVYLTNTDTLLVRVEKPSTLYKTPFIDDRNCIKIEGFVMSTDEFPSVAITSQHSEIETYELEVKRRWYQLWKPKQWKERYTKCGDLKVLEIDKTK